MDQARKAQSGCPELVHHITNVHTCQQATKLRRCRKAPPGDPEGQQYGFCLEMQTP